MNYAVELQRSKSTTVYRVLASKLKGVINKLWKKPRVVPSLSWICCKNYNVTNIAILKLKKKKWILKKKQVRVMFHISVCFCLVQTNRSPRIKKSCLRWVFQHCWHSFSVSTPNLLEKKRAGQKSSKSQAKFNVPYPTLINRYHKDHKAFGLSQGTIDSYIMYKNMLNLHSPHF